MRKTQTITITLFHGTPLDGRESARRQITQKGFRGVEMSRLVQRVESARNIRELHRRINSEYVALIGGDYSSVPTWGPKTEAVELQISASCGEGDIVSWDTRSRDQNKHVYLRRAGDGFYLISHKDYVAAP